MARNALKLRRPWMREIYFRRCSSPVGTGTSEMGHSEKDQHRRRHDRSTSNNGNVSRHAGSASVCQQPTFPSKRLLKSRCPARRIRDGAHAYPGPKALRLPRRRAAGTPSSARSAGLATPRVIAIFRRKTARGSSGDIWSSGANAPASARRRDAPTAEIAATWSHGHCAHACGSPFLRGLAALAGPTGATAPAGAGLPNSRAAPRTRRGVAFHNPCSTHPRQDASG